MGRPQKYKVELSDEQIVELKSIIRAKKTSKMMIKRCQILLDMDENHGQIYTREQCAKSGSVTKDLNIKKGYGIIGKKQNGEESEMAKIEVKCPYCGQEKVVKYGKSRSGKQKFKCCNDECSRKIFQLEYEKNAYYPGVKEQVVEMAMNGAGVRDTGRVLKIAKDTVSGVLKKQKISRNK